MGQQRRGGVMRTTRFYEALACFSLLMLAGASPARAEGPAGLPNENMPGDLESPHDLGCIGTSSVSPQDNPVDLYRAAKACMDAQRYGDAFELIRLAGTYGQFDMLRVADRTAHEALASARSRIFAPITDAMRDQFSQAAARRLGDAGNLAAFCKDMNRWGPPTYEPRYMIQHGMMASLDPGNSGLVRHFDRAKAWSKLLASYVNCPAGGQGTN